MYLIRCEFAFLMTKMKFFFFNLLAIGCFLKCVFKYVFHFSTEWSVFFFLIYRNLEHLWIDLILCIISIFSSCNNVALSLDW